MRTYVTSTRQGARLAHIGTSYWTACGVIPGYGFVVSEQVPEGRTVCERCVSRLEPRPPTTAVGDRERRSIAAAARRAQRDKWIMDDLRAGRTKKEILLSRDMSTRTYVRYVGRLRRRVGARTEFQFGYFVGLAEGRKEREGR